MVLSLDSFMNDKHQHLPSYCLAANAQTSHPVLYTNALKATFGNMNSATWAVGQ